MPPAPNTSDKVEPGRYAQTKKRKGGKIGRLIWGVFSMLWALALIILAVLRINFTNLSSLFWALILFALAVVTAYIGLYGIQTWLEERKRQD
jgi:hypothetical protein